MIFVKEKLLESLWHEEINVDVLFRNNHFTIHVDGTRFAAGQRSHGEIYIAANPVWLYR